MWSEEEWATHCHVHHYLGLGCTTGPMLLCVDCARAYAREVGEAVRWKARQIAETLTVTVRPGEIAHVVSQIEVKTP